MKADCIFVLRPLLGRSFILAMVLCLALAIQSGAEVVKFEDAGGSGKVPYNFRIIDDRLMAGGYLFNPVKKNNSDALVAEYLDFLREKGAKSVILLHVPLKDSFTDRLADICSTKKIDLVKMRMNSAEVPDATQTDRLMNLIDAGAYVHCMWGCDRTGAIIAKYLRLKRGYSGAQAFAAIIGGGSHAGPLGGFKKVPANLNLLLYFWPEVARENPEILSAYR